VNFLIRPFDIDDLPSILALSLLAWEPIFAEWQRLLGPDLFPLAIYSDWRKGQTAVVEKICTDPNITTWVADVQGKAVGFISYEMNASTRIGEVQLLAVHPDCQNSGLGTELNRFALQKLKEAGMKLAVLGTGGDEGHAPARRSYEKAGYTGLPLVRYYQAL
jgi:ribosomal protein S18 acetylase RimI-like enzyme